MSPLSPYVHQWLQALQAAVRVHRCLGGGRYQVQVAPTTPTDHFVVLSDDDAPPASWCDNCGCRRAQVWTPTALGNTTYVCLCGAQLLRAVADMEECAPGLTRRPPAGLEIFDQLAPPAPAYCALPLHLPDDAAALQAAIADALSRPLEPDHLRSAHDGATAAAAGAAQKRPRSEL